ncbi:MAG: tape measure protein [Peptococcaceae bacterium]|nr:tape measure protein [Peptococcaceae bacterium]
MNASISTIDQFANSLQSLAINRELFSQGNFTGDFEYNFLRKTKDEILETKIAWSAVQEQTLSAKDSQAMLNEEMQRSSAIAMNWQKQVDKVKVSLGKAFNVKGIMTTADNLVNSKAQLNNVMLVYDDGGSIGEIEEKVMASAQRSRAGYLDMVSNVAKLGLNAKDTFNSMDEVIGFQELINKQFIIGGASVQEQQAAMGQLTQAMASGVLRGEELNAIFATAPGIVQNIADYMHVPVERVKGLAAEGQITAQVVKNAMFAASDEIESKFDSMPMTWGQVWTNMKNTALSIFSPILEGITALASSPIVTGLAETLAVTGKALVDNWGLFGPIIIGVASAWGIYTAAIKAQAIAQAVANAEFLKSPYTWILVGIIAIVMAISKWVQSVGGLKIAWATTIMNIRNFIGDLRVWALEQWDKMINGFIDMWNSLATMLNKTGLFSFELMGHVNHTAFKGLKNEAEKMLRGVELEKMKMEIDNKAKENEQNMETLKNNTALAAGVDGLSQSSAQTAENTAAMSNSMEMSEEDLRYMRDIAEREAINRFTTAEVKVDMTGMTNRIDSNMDLDGVLTTLTDGFAEALEVAAEGVHV